MQVKYTSKFPATQPSVSQQVASCPSSVSQEAASCPSSVSQETFIGRPGPNLNQATIETFAGCSARLCMESRRAPVGDAETASLLLNSITTSHQTAFISRDIYKYRIVKAGKVVMVYEYEKLQGIPRQQKSSSSGEERTDLERIISRMDNLNRSKAACRNIINANLDRYSNPDKFVTLTFKDDIRDLETANREFKIFIQRLNRYLKKHGHGQAKYVCVPEPQDKTRGGVIHFHVIFFGLPYIPNVELRKLWGQGFVRINAISKYSDIAGYLVNYMRKSVWTGKEREKKRYFTSCGLVQAEVIKSLVPLQEPDGDLLAYERQYENDFCGHVTFRRYVLRERETGGKLPDVVELEKKHSRGHKPITRLRIIREPSTS